MKGKSADAPAKPEAAVIEDQVSLLREEIGALREQLSHIERNQDDLQVQVSQIGTGPAKTPTAAVTAKTLTDRKVQKALAAAGYYSGPIDGKIGPKTKTAIKAFQRARGLKVDGVIGPQTRTALAEYLKD